MKSYRVAYLNRQFAALAKLAGKDQNPNAWEIGQSLYRRLRRVEAFAHRKAEDYCNRVIDSDGWDKAHEDIEWRVKRIFYGVLPPGFRINGDPRGYALKIDAGTDAGSEPHPEYIPEGMHTDWGGYGILAPDFDN